jgi:Trk K+ transport system NAD-binding subunit
MNIIIIGAGDVGTHLAGTLIAEGHDITVIDRDPDRLSVLNQNYDLLALEGNGANPRLLRNAGLERADMLLAVTSTDEVNLLAAFIAGNRRVPRIVARVQDQEYLTDLAILSQQHSSVKFVHPAEVISRELVGLVQHAEALESHTFADGRITVMELDMEESDLCALMYNGRCLSGLLREGRIQAGEKAQEVTQSEWPERVMMQADWPFGLFNHLKQGAFIFPSLMSLFAVFSGKVPSGSFKAC